MREEQPSPFTVDSRFVAEAKFAEDFHVDPYSNGDVMLEQRALGDEFARAFDANLARSQWSGTRSFVVRARYTAWGEQGVLDATIEVFDEKGDILDEIETRTFGAHPTEIGRARVCAEKLGIVAARWIAGRQKH